MIIEFTLPHILLIAVGVLAIFDGVTRLRGARASSVLAVVEIVVGVLLLLTLIPAFPVTWGATLLSAILLATFIIVLVLRGGAKRKGFASVTVIATILDLILLLNLLHVLVIPGLLP
jgi:hypothetical protein